MRNVDEQDLREAIADEVESLEPSDQLWNAIYQRSVSKMEKRTYWKKSLMALAAAAAAVVFVVTTQGGQTEPPAANGPATMAAPNESGAKTLPADTLPIHGQDPQEQAPPKIVRYRYASYFLIDRTVSADQLGEVLVKSHQDRTGKPSGEGQVELEGDGYASFLEPGTEIRTIKGVDPKEELAVPYEGKWYVVDSFLDAPELLK